MSEQPIDAEAMRDFYRECPKCGLVFQIIARLNETCVCPRRSCGAAVPGRAARDASPVKAEAMKWALEGLAGAAKEGARQTLASADGSGDATQILAATDRSLCLGLLAIEMSQRAAGHWTREAPTAEGFYFVRLNGRRDVVEYSRGVNGDWASLTGCDSVTWPEFASEGYERWSVPIEPPA